MLSGCLMGDRSMMPERMQEISRVTPHAWALDAYRQLLTNPTPDLGLVQKACGMLVGFATVFLGLAWASMPARSGRTLSAIRFCLCHGIAWACVELYYPGVGSKGIPRPLGRFGDYLSFDQRRKLGWLGVLVVADSESSDRA